MEPWAQFTFGQDSFVSRVDLHGKLQGQWRIVELLCRLLQFLKVKGVVEGAHVQKYCDSVLLQGFGGLLTEETFEGHVESSCSWSGSVIVHGWREVSLPLIQDWFS